MKRFPIGGVAAVMLVSAGLAYAKPATAPTAHTPSHRAPKNETRADVQTRVQAMFNRLDANHDGFLTKDEVAAAAAQREAKAEQRAARFDPGKVFDRIDANHDGQITAVEAQAGRRQHAQTNGGQPAVAHATALPGLFARADVNKDGVVTRAEFQAMGSVIKGRMEQAGMRGGFAGKMFETADANRDGRVSLAEAQALALQHFDRADLNHDGIVMPQEREQARQQLRGQHKPS